MVIDLPGKAIEGIQPKTPGYEHRRLNFGYGLNAIIQPATERVAEPTTLSVSYN
jgi:hypothetical protein